MATVKDVLEKKGSYVACVETDATVLEATHFMVERRVGALVICDKEMVVGIFTERLLKM